jgi:hypothetical protein
VEQGAAASHDADPAQCDPSVNLGEPGGEDLQSLLLRPSFGLGGIAASAPGPAAGRGGQPCPDASGRPKQARPLIEQIAIGPLPLGVAGSGDGSRPPAGTGADQLAASAGPLLVPGAEMAAVGQVATGQATEVLTDLAEHGLVLD